eukprot:XP_016661059.1 PREDICTED: uncharacterized protein LOC107884097 [Acyrthosiphon pisum]
MSCPPVSLKKTPQPRSWSVFHHHHLKLTRWRWVKSRRWWWKKHPMLASTLNSLLGWCPTLTSAMMTHSLSAMKNVRKPVSLKKTPQPRSWSVFHHHHLKLTKWRWVKSRRWWWKKHPMLASTLNSLLGWCPTLTSAMMTHSLSAMKNLNKNHFFFPLICFLFIC